MAKVGCAVRISVGRFPSDGPAFGSPSLIPLR